MHRAPDWSVCLSLQTSSSTAEAISGARARSSAGGTVTPELHAGWGLGAAGRKRDRFFCKSL